MATANNETISTLISTLQADRNTIRAKLIELGLATSSDKLDRLAQIISEIVKQGGVSISVKEGETFTIPAGYHDGTGTVSGVAGGGDYDLQSKTVTPTKVQQSVTPDQGYYGLSDVTVNAIPDVYQDTSSVTAAVGDVLTGKIFVDKDGSVITGNMPNNGAVTKTLSVTTVSYTIAKGYHNGSGKVSISLETKSVTPTKSAQEITPSSGKVLSKVTVAKIPDAYQDVTSVTAGAGDVLAGEVIVSATGEKITGDIPIIGAVDQSLNTTTTSYTVPEGYHNGEGVVDIALETKTATPSKTAQNITPSTGKVLSKVTVNRIPDVYQDVSGVTAVASAVLDGYVFVNSGGNEIEGTIPANGATGAEIDGLTTTSYTIPAGYTTGGTVSLTDDIERALASI